MPTFTKSELQAVEALAEGKSGKDLDVKKDVLEGLLKKLGASSQAEIPELFRSVTGWANKPTDYA